MSSVAREAFASAAPGKTKEIETKRNFRSFGELRIAFGAVHEQVRGHPLTVAYYEQNDEPFLRRVPGKPGLLVTNPISVYIDDALRTLHNSEGGDFRQRLTPYLDRFVQWGVKGNSQKFDGEGGALRDEDEKIGEDCIHVPKALLANVDTSLILQPIRGVQLYNYFATDPEREMFLLPVEVGSKIAAFEVCADPIRYKNVPKDAKVCPRGAFAKSADVEVFHNLAQLETEYINPLKCSPHVRGILAEFGVSVLNYDEVEEAVRLAAGIINNAVGARGLTMTPTEASKGDVGFREGEKRYGWNDLSLLNKAEFIL